MSALLRLRHGAVKLHGGGGPDPSRLLRKASMSSMLERYGHDLTAAAARGGGDPVFGRDKEINRVLTILSRKSKNSAVLVGAAGVGKTAIAEGLARRIARGEVLRHAGGARGGRYRGGGGVQEPEEGGAVRGRNPHVLLGAGLSEGSNVDVSNMLKPALARGQLRCLGATTHDEYQRYFLKDAAFERRFQKVHVPEPTEDDTVAILQKLKPTYEKHHGVKIQKEALVAAVRLSDRYVSARQFPDKAIDLVDEACASARLRTEQLKKEGVLPKDGNKSVVDPEDIAQVVSAWTGIPATRLGRDERTRLLELPERLHRRVLGQDEAVRVVADAVLSSRSGLASPSRSSGSFLFLGPTGVGKTELAKALAEELFGDERALIRVDMSEYVCDSSVSRLIDSAPGMIGCDQGGQLTELVRQRPYSVVLFDEVEKAAPAVFNLFLQILDEGRLTDGQGRTADFTNTIIIMTSNLGARHLVDDDDCPPEDTRERVLAEVKERLRPELINRLDEMLKTVAHRLAGKGIGLNVTDAALDVLLSKTSGEVRTYGARPIRRCVEKDVMKRICRMVVREEVDHGFEIAVDADAEKKDLVFNVRKSSAEEEKKPVQPASDESNASSSNDADVTKSCSVQKPKKPRVKRSTKRPDKAGRC
ncbi:hypothetical protein EJB05_06173, partial [Eragrostis curvula]